MHFLRDVTYMTEYVSMIRTTANRNIPTGKEQCDVIASIASIASIDHSINLTFPLLDATLVSSVRAAVC